MFSPERQSAQMSKITNDGLTRSGTVSSAHMATVGVKGLMNIIK